MIVVSDIVTKPENFVSWNKCMTYDIFFYMSGKYFNSDNILLYHGNINGNTQETLTVFKNIDVYNEYNSDSTLEPWRNCVLEYNNLHGITKSNIQVRNYDEIPEEEKIKIQNLLGTYGIYNNEQIVEIETFIE
jgi:hypothetical protein